MDTILSGKSFANGDPFALTNARVEAWDASDKGRRPLSTCVVQKGGVFSLAIPYRFAQEAERKDATIELRVVFRGAPVRVDPPVTWRPGDPEDGLEIHATLDREGREVDGARSVFGRVTHPRAGTSVEGLVVRAYDRDLRDEQLLGETRTDRVGRYAASYTRGDFARSEKAYADLVVRVFDPSGETVLFDPRIEDILYNAGPEVRFDIRISGDVPPDRNEFERLLAAVKPLLGSTELVKLSEDAENRDISFLERELSVAGAKLEHLVVAHRLGEMVEGDAAVFYALLRMDTLLSDADLLPIRTAIGVNDDTRDILLDAARVDADSIKGDVEAATEARIVPRKTAKKLGPVLEALERLRREAGDNGTQTRLRTVIERAEALIDRGRLEKLADVLTRSRGHFKEFLAELVETDWLEREDLGAGTRLDLADVLGADGVTLETLAAGDAAAEAPDTLRFAALRLDELGGLVRETDPEAPDDVVRRRVVRLAREAEARHPTVAFRAQLENGSKAVRDPAATLELLEQHEDLTLESTNLDAFFAERQLEGEQDRRVLADLKRVQRVRKLAPDLERTEKLLERRVHSASDVVALGRARFMSDIAPEVGLTRAEAEATFNRAERTHTAALMIAGDISTMSGAAPAAAGPGDLTAAADQLTAQFPNLATLFHLTDECKCTHCRSVLSPAAYLVELLEFLDRRGMVDLTQSPPVSVNVAKQILLSRRGEIADLDLNCANAETPLPYIDLICEILEEEVSPDPGVPHAGPIAPGVIPAALLATLQAEGWPITDAAIVQPPDINGDFILRDELVTAKLVDLGGNNWQVHRLRQTHGTAAELSAAPEYVNAAAYAALASANYAFTLPFDLSHAEATAYFERFGVARADLMRDFQTAGAPPAEAIAAEGLGLTDAERLLIVTPDPAGQSTIWGLPAATVVADMTVVATMLDKTGLTYAELDRLLQLDFIDPAGTMFIRHLDLSCDLTQKEVTALDSPALDRIHRFLRLQRGTGWADTVLDAAIIQSALGNGTLDDAALIRLEEMQRVSDRTGLKPEELTASFGDVPHDEMTGTDESPLYHRIFLDKTALGFVEEGLRPEAVGAGGTLSGLAAPLAALLKLTAGDFESLRVDLTDDQLTFGNLSTLFGAARLSDRLRLSIPDFLILRRRSGIDPFAGPTEMLEFVDAVERARSGPVRIGDMPFMLEHGGDVGVREIGDDKVTELLEELQAAYQTAFEETRSAFNPDLTAEELRTPIKDALLRLPGLEEAQANDVLRMYDARWTAPPDPAPAVTLDAHLGGYFDTAPVVAAEAAVAAAAPAAVEAARMAMADTLLGLIATYLHNLVKRTALTESLTAFFRQGEELVNPVLDGARLRQPGPTTPQISDVLTDDVMIDPGGNPPAILPAAFPDQFRAVRLLHKLLPLATDVELEPDDLNWMLEHAGDMGWVELDAIPYEAGHTAISRADWERLTGVLGLFDAFPPTPNPANPTAPATLAGTLELLLPGNATTQPQWLDALVLLTGYDRDALEDLDAHFGWSAPNLDGWRAPDAWELMIRCMDGLRAISASVAEAVSYVQPVLTATETAALRIALKARYAESIWLTTLGEITDTIRPQKRDALVAFLLAEHPEWSTPTDLYDHFLIDVEMESKMPSSRIVQAHGTIQLFVERSRMGLEPEAAADSSDTGWDQWIWLRNYRVWEANRKVFIHPENWIEPELLDSKSFLFQALEDGLLQNEVNEFTAEDGFIAYLEGLDHISFLEVVAVYYEAAIYTMHVFARTKGGDPAQYYHRRFEKERYWTPWSLVELDITSDNLLTFVRNGRLHLAWPVISEETNPDQDVTTPGVTDSPSSGPMQHPEARLRVQLALSEYANGEWKPRKISQDAIVAPLSYTTDPHELNQDKYNLLYNQFSDDVWLFHTSVSNDWESHTLDGVFDVAGCKGYPEVIWSQQQWLPDFFPDYKDTLLSKQRYRELGWDVPLDTLAIRNMITFWDFVVRLDKTPGVFRITHPHQFTLIDLIYVLLQILFWNALKRTSVGHDRLIKLPFGTWLPYFFEDSDHAYVVVPGLYSDEEGVDTRRTFSDILTLIQDIIALIVKYYTILTATPAPDPADVLADLAVDPDYLRIRDEIQVYMTLRFGEQFRELYHPLICPLRSTLYKHGVGRMMERDRQLQQTSFDFDTTFAPNAAIVTQPYPIEDIDFDADGSYSSYNWELFFHAPLMIAKRLASEQRFDEAMVWYHRIFNPTGTLVGTSPQKYWVTKPFYLTTDADYIAQRIDTLLTNVADPTSPERHELEFAIDEWRIKPFRPHVVARFRTVAYQRTVVMSYIGTLIEWGDYLFRQDTMESITQATQMYVLADKLLGPKPRNVPPPVEPTAQTYSQLVGDLDAFGNALVELENYLPDLGVLPEGGAELPPPPVTLSSLYFCIPPNEKMLRYWDTVADRLFKVRNSQNIDGVERVLALFAPPIDPGMLVRAAAAGLDLSSILAGMNAPLPAYRFQVLAGKAADLAMEVRQLGSALLAALEKKDAEALALLRNDLEISLFEAQRDLKIMEIDAANEQIEVLRASRTITEERNAFYDAFERINPNEQLNLDKLGEAQGFEVAAGVVRATGAVLGIIPDFSAGGHGAGGSPAVHATFGGSTLAQVAEAAATVLSVLSGVASYEATRAGTLGRFDRTKDDADLQARLSKHELAHIDQQIAAAELRRDIAVKDLDIHDVQIENAKRISEAMEDKYTNTQLYQWMVNDITQVYYRAYQLAYDTAKRAERCYQHELGVSSTFLSFGYWDSRKKGLQTANKLFHDIRRMEGSYLEANKREYEVTKHVSLRQLDPLALVRLRTAGVCDFEIPEAMYDIDHPGHYFRRIRTVAVSIPCVAGPYASISGRLTQVTNRYRGSTARAAGAATPKEEYEEAPGNDTRFVYNVGSSQSVATSSGQNDAGLFQLDFRDDRYLPFEGTGAVSTWRFDLANTVRQFDYATISDLIIHVRYTAREGGSSLRALAEISLAEKLQEVQQGLAKTGLHFLIDIKRDYYDAWHELKATGATNLTIGPDRLPYFVQLLNPVLGTVTFLAKVTGDPAMYSIGVDAAPVSLNFSPEWGLNLNDHAGVTLDTPFALTTAAPDIAALEDLALVLKVDFA